MHKAKPRRGSAEDWPPLSGGAGVATVHAAVSVGMPTAASAAQFLLAGSVTAGTMIVAGSDGTSASHSTIVFGSDSVSIGGVASVIEPHAALGGTLRIDMQTLHLAGADSTAPLQAPDDTTLRLPGGTRTDLRAPDNLTLIF
jgi:hypothetical protein